ncbi:MAG: lysylphosphatidylglycerol synthase transmembrane domain-containing protein [Chitinophagaceae bacterium]
MNKKILSSITYIVTLGLGIFLIWYSVKDLSADDVQKIKHALKQANFIYLIPIVIMGFISHWSRAKRWKYLMEPLHMYPSTGNTLLAVLIGYLANLAFPRLGEVLKCTILARYEKVPADKLVGTIVAERAFDLLCLIIVFFLAFIVQINLAQNYLSSLLLRYQSQSNGDHAKTYIVLGAILALSFALYFGRKKIATLSFFKKIKSVFQHIIQGILSFRTMKNKKGFVFHTILIWCMYLGMILIGFQSIQETAHLHFPTALSVLSFGSVGMIVTPGGIGAYTILVEEIVSLYGIEKIISIAISWIIWLVPTFIILFGGLIALIILPIYNRKKHEQ